MDTIITGGAASGKTTAAHDLLAGHFGVKSIYDVTLSQLLIVTQMQLDRADFIASLVRTARVEAVLFDGCITNDDDFMAALEGVKQARVTCGRNLYAVYVRQGEGALSVIEHPENFNI